MSTEPTDAFREMVRDEVSTFRDRVANLYYMNLDRDVEEMADWIVDLVRARSEPVNLTLGNIYGLLMEAVERTYRSDQYRITDAVYSVVLLMLDQAYEDGRHGAAG